MPERVVAELEALVVEPLHLLEAPLILLAFDSSVAEEVVSGGCPGQHAEYGGVSPIGMCLSERQPDSDAARRVDFELSVLLDVPELAG